MMEGSFYEEDDSITAQNAAKTQPPSGGIAKRNAPSLGQHNDLAEE